ncbi:MAG: type II secretion system F family protein [Bdellovibrionota bacterium]|nr:type II secretion system F family protein [Bdellovibrionota bacterium]
MSFLGQDWILIIGIAAATFVFVMANAERVMAWFYDKSLGNRQYVLDKFDLMFIENTKKQVTITMLLLSFGLGFVVFMLFWPSLFPAFFFGGIMTFIGAQIPKIMVDMVYEKRCKKFVAQMVEGMSIMGNGIKAGKSVQQAMENVVANLGNPIRQEFEFTLSQMRLGLSLEEALTNLQERVPEQDVQMFVMSVNILNNSGGDLAKTFNTITDTIRERQKIHNKIDALTAQGKAQGMIMTAMPFALFFIFMAIDPGYVRPLYSTTGGFIIIFIMLLLIGMGGYFMRKVTTIKV